MNTRKIKLIYGSMLCAVITPFILLACSAGGAIGDQGTLAGNFFSQRPSDAPSNTQTATGLTPHEHCQAVIASVVDAGFEDEARVSCHSGHATIHSDSYASHEMMTGIVGTNEQIPLPAPGYHAPIVFNSSFSASPQTRDSSLGIAVNGIPIFDYSAGGEMSIEDLYSYHPNHDAMALQQIDICGGHTGRGDDYHYHELPRCMIEQMDNKDDNPIIGWGFDGFPLYGNTNPDGSAIAIGDLDVCHGQPDDKFGYRYHTSDEPPYIWQCLVGEVELNEVPTIGIDRPSGVPVMVEDLTFDHDNLGNGLMTYDYRGSQYYIKSAATEDPNCFVVEWKTVTNGGNVESGEYCNIIRTGGGGMGGPPRDARQNQDAMGAG